jgi:hypothetical protein
MAATRKGGGIPRELGNRFCPWEEGIECCSTALLLITSLYGKLAFRARSASYSQLRLLKKASMTVASAAMPDNTM